MENPFNDAFEKWEKATSEKHFGVPRVPKQDTPQQFKSVPVEEPLKKFESEDHILNMVSDAPTDKP